jgi:hypothetical protein
MHNARFHAANKKNKKQKYILAKDSDPNEIETPCHTVVKWSTQHRLPRS